ncbi:MAG TPA: coproporphyrinogen III oxidase, partial [Planctomycetota bacterium]|nr:coproporphyrinogen III oxidase [Planctomycetota bacterium]
ENFNDRILEENGRAHRSPEVYRAYEWATRLDFRSINVDLIAGMVGETNENWRENIRRTIELSPDSVTIYQMELPYNTIYSKDVTSEYSPVADWKTKREWVDFAFAELQAAGYHVSSAYTLVKRPDVRFVYRDGLWHGADLLGAGVSSFGHLSGIHYQNEPNIDAYCDKIERGEHPWQRAFPTTSRQRMIRELILQLKTGAIERGYFANKFGSDPLEAFPGVIDQYRAKGLLTTDETHVRLTREGLLRADAMLEAFFDPDHRGARYT